MDLLEGIGNLFFGVGFYSCYILLKVSGIEIYYRDNETLLTVGAMSFL